LKGFTVDIREYIDCSLVQPACFVLVEQLCCHPPLTPRSGAKYQFICPVYYVTLNSNCEAQRVSKN